MKSFLVSAEWSRAFVFVFVLASGVALSGTAFAQPAQVSDRSTEFRAATGPTTESVPGGNMLLAAYGVMWLVLLGYVVRLGVLQGKTRADLARLETLVRSPKASDAK